MTRLTCLVASALLSTAAVMADAPAAAVGAVSSELATSASIRLAGKAEAALRKARADRAIPLAERAVAASPRVASHRLLLGRAYLAGGRFASAEIAFDDARTLDPAQSAALPRLLTQIALGRMEAARATLAAADEISPADRGLALALLGDDAGAVATLEVAVRDGAADAKTRQNLGLAYGLAGDWRRAMNVAAVDLPRGQLLERMLEWNRLAQLEKRADAVAPLLGAPVIADPGFPVALALRPATPAVQQAAAIPIVVPPAYVAPAPVLALAAPLVPLVATPLQMPQLSRAAVVRPVSLAIRPVLVRPAAVQVREGGFVVQLGAFATAAGVQAAWRTIGGVDDYVPSSAPVMTRRGMLYRLTLAGFATRVAAVQVCERVKARGGACFVRARAGETPMRWAAPRKATASRA